MWGWKRDVEHLQESLKRFDTALDDLATCCSKNAEAVNALEREQHAVRSDVDLQWDKVNTAIGRMAKRDAVQEKKVNGEDGLADLNERIRRGDPIG